MKSIFYKDFKNPENLKEILLDLSTDYNKGIFNSIKKSRERPWFYTIRQIKLVKYIELDNKWKIKITVTSLKDILFKKKRVIVFWIYKQPSPDWLCRIPVEGE